MGCMLVLCNPIRRSAIGSGGMHAYLNCMAHDLPRATKRPEHVRAPAGWTNPPVPQPEAVPFVGLVEDGRPDPVRYGDWERKGIAIDF
jgi:hypothetical protein